MTDKPESNRDSFKVAYKTSLRLLVYIWDYDKKMVVGYFAAIIIPGLIPYLNAFIYAQIINFVVHHVSGQSTSYHTLYYLVAARLISLLVQDVAFTFQRVYVKQLWARFPLHLFQSVLGSIAELDLQSFEDSDFKNKLERVKESFNWRPINMFSDMGYLAQGVVQVLVAFASLIFLNWIFAVLIFLSAIPTLIYQARAAQIGWSIYQADTPIRKRFEYLSGLLQQTYSVKELKLYRLSQTFLSDLKKAQLTFINNNDKALKDESRKGVLANLSNVVAYVVIELYIILKALSKKISLGSLTYYTTVLVNYQQGVNGMFGSMSNIYDRSQYVREMFEVIDAKPAIVSPPDAVKLKLKRAPKIEFKNVTFSYPGTNRKTLDNFSLVIEPGQKIAFVGENGAGKTTIVKLLARFYDIDEGEILINGVSIDRLDLADWYDQLGVLFQDFLKYEYSLEDNIYFGLIHKPKVVESIIDAAKQAGAHDVASGLPNNYTQMLGSMFEDSIDLSIGQWQKVALARGFYRNSHILILDEPTASIDAKAESEIFKKVEKLSSNKTVLIISHRFSTVRNADKIYVLNKGKIEEEGSHNDLMKLDGIYAKLFKLQAEAYR